MVDLIVKLIAFLSDKFASASKYIFAGVLGAFFLLAVVAYFFGRQMIEPTLDYYLMTRINSYFEGENGVLAKGARQVDPNIKNVALAQLKSITESLYDEVDAVYPISNSVTRADIQKLGSEPLSFNLYLYADLTKHRVILFLNRRQSSFDFSICFNGPKSCKERSSNLVGEDITEQLRQNPLTSSNAGVESERLTYPPNIQLITIAPLRLRLEEGDVASLEGYVMVKRAIQGLSK
jgi:hypothetical protein